MAALDVVLPGRVLAWRTAALAAVAVWIVLAVARPDLLALRAVEFDQDHALVSIDIAIGRAFCDSPSKISTLVRVPYEARDHAELRTRSVRSILLERAGTIERFCLSVGSPIVNNENALMWLDSWLFWLMPELSLEGLAGVLHWFQLAAVAGLTTVLLQVGGGVLVAGVTTFFALVVLHRIDHLVLTAYPLDFAFIVATAALGVTIASAGRPIGRVAAMAMALVLGAWVAFGANLRTSHLPVFLVLAALSVAFAERAKANAEPRKLARAARVVALLFVFAAGYTSFEWLAITRHLPEGMADSAHHTTWHSTVLGLAIPENDLSRREGIVWADNAAWDVAKRFKPDVRYIDAEYEAILSAYYRELWRRDYRTMAAVYTLKFRTAGTQMVAVLRGGTDDDSRWIWWLLRPVNALPHGGYVLALYVAFGAAGALLAWRRHPGGLLLLLLSAAAVLVHLESALITSLYVAHYHAYLAFFLLSICAAGPLLVAGVCWPLWRRRLLVGL